MLVRKRLVVAAAATTVALTATTVVGAEAARYQANDRVKNVIYLLGDGMGRTHVTAARDRYYGAAGELNMEKLPVVGRLGA